MVTSEGADGVIKPFRKTRSCGLEPLGKAQAGPPAAEAAAAAVYNRSQSNSAAPHSYNMA